MSISRQEEIIGVLWVIASLVAFGYGHQILGWVFASKGATDLIISIAIPIIQGLEELRANK